MYPDHGMRRDMSKLSVKCLNPGCPWQGVLKKYEVKSVFCFVMGRDIENNVYSSHLN